MQDKLKRVNNKSIIVLSAFIVLILIRLYHLDAAPIELEESWRQADTESIARNFAEYKFNLLYPNFNYDGPLPNVPALELQVTTFLISILYRLFGHSYLWARLVPLCFFIASGIMLYKFCRKYLSFAGALLSLFIYGVIPINVYYSRAIMPESAGLLFFIGGLYYFDIWLSSQISTKLVVSSMLTALSLMTKPMTIFVVIPMFYLLIKKHGFRWLIDKKLWTYAAFTLGLAFVYYYISIPMAEYKFTEGLARDVLLKELPAAVYNLESYNYIVEKLLYSLTPAGAFLAIAGLISLNKQQHVIIVWFAAMAIELILVVTVIHVLYYFIFFAVPCCILIGQGLSRLYDRLQTRCFSIIMLVLLLLNSYVIVKPMYTINTVMETQVRLVKEITGRNDLIVVGSMDPCLLGLSGRRGWRFNLDIYSNIPSEDTEELKLYISKGAKYFVPIQGKIYKDENGEIIKYLDKNYEKIEAVKGFPIYKLQ